MRRCRDAGLIVVLATSGSKDDLEWMLPCIGAQDAIAGVVTSDDVDEGKPAPDLQSAAIATYELDPELTVAVGDSVWDVAAADRAGLPCLALESGGISASTLLQAGARHTYLDAAELLRQFEFSLLAVAAGLPASGPPTPAARRSE